MLGEQTKRISDETGLPMNAASIVSMLGKGGMGAALLAILLYFGQQMLDEQRKLTSAVVEGNIHMQRMTQEISEAAKEMQESRIAFQARKD